MDTHAPIAYYQTAIPLGHQIQYPSGRSTLGVGPLESLAIGAPLYAGGLGQMPVDAPGSTPTAYSTPQYHSTSTVPTSHQQQQQAMYQQQATMHPQQKQQHQQRVQYTQPHYIPLVSQGQVSSQTHLQMLQQQQQQQPQRGQQIPSQHATLVQVSTSQAYKQHSSSQQPYVQQAQPQQRVSSQHSQQHAQPMQQAQQFQQLQPQYMQHSFQGQQGQQRHHTHGSSTSASTQQTSHQVQVQMQSHKQHPSGKSQAQPQHSQQQQYHHHPRDTGRDHRGGSSNSAAMELVISPQTSTLQLAEFASVMVYTLWHTRPNINGASSNAYNVVPHRMTVPPSAGPAFKKFCLKVLSATQLSSSVILLSLKYIQKLLKNNPSIHGQQGSEFRLFTVSLMLANKFLDDNTFTNKTWSEVTGISVKEINVMEMEFLNQVKFSLFVSEAEYLDWLHSLETWLKQQGQPQTSN